MKKNIKAWLKRMAAARRFDKIALYLGSLINYWCPFYTRAGYNDILIGTPDSGVQHPGYLGWNVFDRMPKSSLSVKERRQLIKNPRIQKKLKRIYRRSQKYLIKPMMIIMFEKGDEMFQAEMNRYLNLDKLDIVGRQPDRVAAELFARLRAQKIMEKYKPGRNVFHIKKGPRMDYTPSVFTIPTTLGFSKGHEVTLRILEGLVETLPFFHDCNKWTITNEHRNPDKHGYTGWMSYDIALWKNDVLWGLIEFDGKQHYEQVDIFHGKGKKGNEKFRSLQKKDKIKDADALLLCNDKKCLRVGPECGAGTAQARIKAQIVDWLE